jgi:hypothetical protein
MRQQRSLKPRSRESVVNRQIEAQSGNDLKSLIPAGDKSINPKLTNVRLDRLRCYNGGKTVIRIWPMLDPENPTGALLHGRQSAIDTAGLGGVSISEPVFCVQYAGINKDSGMLLPQGQNPEACSYIISKNKNSTIEGVNFWDEPYVRLYSMAKKAMEAGAFADGRAWDSLWNPLLTGKMPGLTSFKQKYFIVCSIYENGAEFNLDREKIEYMQKGKLVTKETPRNGVPLGEAPGDPLIVIGVSVSAGRKILELCNRQKSDWSGNEIEKPYLPFIYGDPTGRFNAEEGIVKGGVFFTLYNPTKLTIDAHSSFKGVANPAAVEYEAAVGKVYDGPAGALNPSLSKEQVDNIMNKHIFLWKSSNDDPADSYLLHEPTLEERCVLIAKAFRYVPKLLEFCWMSKPEYLQYSEVSAILKNRSTTAVVKPDMVDEDEDYSDDAVEAAAPKSTAKPASKLQPVVKGKPVKVAKSASEIVDEFEDEIDEDELEDEDGGEEEEIGSKGKPAKQSGKPKVSKDKFEDDDADEEDGFDDEADNKLSKGSKDNKGSVSKGIGGNEEDEDFEESDDFDDETDNSGLEADLETDLEEQLNQSVSRANAIARSRNRTSPEPESSKKPRRSK